MMPRDDLPPPAPPTGWTWRDYMTPSSLILISLFFLLIFFVFSSFIVPTLRDYTAFWNAPEGIVEQAPVITPTTEKPFVFMGSHGFFTRKNVYLLTPVKAYALEARVLHTRHYTDDKNSADLIPFDMGLGWNIMSDAEKLGSYFLFHHSNVGGRVLWIEPKGDWQKIPPVYLSQMQEGTFFSNNHLIPASQAVFEKLAAMKAGDIVKMQGFLVDVTRPSDPSYRWITSKHAREDGEKNSRWGDGASFDNLTTCDTFFVTLAEIIQK